MLEFEVTGDLVAPQVFMTKIGESVKLVRGEAELQISGLGDPFLGEAWFDLQWDGRGLVGGFKALVAADMKCIGDGPRSASLKITNQDLSSSVVSVEVEERNLPQQSLFSNEIFLEFQCRVTTSRVEFSKSGRVALKDVRAHLLNVPPYLGIPIAVSPYSTAQFTVPGRLKLLSEGWRVTVDYLVCWALGAPDFGESSQDVVVRVYRLFRDARTIGGSLITHAVRLERATGALFSPEQADSALRRLETFLKFAFGGPGEPVLVYGFNSEGEIEWKSFPTDPGQPTSGGRRKGRSWLPLISDEAGSASAVDELNSSLSAAFESWMRQSADPESTFSKTIIRAVEWYVASLESRSKSQSIVMAQASLEVLSNYCLQARLNLSEKSQQRLDFADQLTATLSIIGVDINVPDSLSVLRGWKLVGPSVITKARNSIVHPRAINKDLSEDEIAAVQALSIWYVERVLFQLLGYRGLYWNRIERKLSGV